MKKAFRPSCCFFLLLGLALPLTSHAFLQWQNEDTAVEIRGFARAVGVLANNANDDVLYEKDEILGAGVFGRLMLDAQWTALSAEIHLVQNYLGDELRTGGSRFASFIDIERSDGLQWRYSDGNADLVVDRLNVQYQQENLRLKLGRQPINLAATFYFTPNDFFAPFAAQTFFRTYKPGVDAARLDWQWSDASQLSLISVLDYPLDIEQPTGRKTSPDWSETAYLARASTLLDTFQWAALAGKIDGDDIVGFDVQGELFEWLGVRAEGHLRFADEDDIDRDAKLAIAFDHRWPNTFTARVEHLYQRSGANDRDDYSLSQLTNPNSFYLVRNYTALGGSYEFTPLLLGDAVWLYNHQDSSSLLALYSTYSLSDESELSVGLNIPMGKQPDNGQLKTEFGSFPLSLTMEYRIYF